jgi:hypothetical protein
VLQSHENPVIANKRSDTMKRRLVISALLAVMLLVTIPQAASAYSQSWYLSSNSATSGDYVMYKGSQSGGTSEVTISAGSTLCWTADDPAECDVTFSAGDWIGQLEKSTSLSLVLTYTVSIGYWDVSGDNFVSKGSASGSFILLATTSDFTIEAVPSFTVEQGDYLALQIENTTALTAIDLVTADGASWVEYPLDEPAYPVPELPTIILLAAGSVFLVGYLVLKRRKKAHLRA